MNASVKRKMVDLVIEHKNNIEDATSQIKERLSRVRPAGGTLDHESVGIVQQQVDRVVKELSIIGGFCGGGERNYIYTVSRVAGALTAAAYIDYYIASALRLWCTMVNSIIIDFGKTPFKFSGSFKVNLKNLEAQVKALYKRK